MKKLAIFTYPTILLLSVFFTYAFLDQNLSYYKLIYTGIAFKYRFETVLIYICLILVLFSLFIYFLKLYQKHQLSISNVKFLLSMAVIILFFSYPAMLSYDIYNYIATAKVTYQHHENPYVVSPAELRGDPLLDFMHASHKTALYGPFWILLTYIPYLIGLNNFILTLFSVKLVITVFYLFTLLLIFKLSLSWYKVLAFALNPLIMIETLVSSHNDIVMMFLVLLSYFLVKKKKIFLAVLLFTFSILVKYATIFLFPVFIYLIYSSLKKRLIDWNKIYFCSFILMLIIFLLSPLREEMYPWYALWFYLFLVLADSGKNILNLVLSFMLGLSLKYVPFMYIGLYNQTTIISRTFIIFIPLIIYSIIFLTKNIYFKNEKNYHKR